MPCHSWWLNNAQAIISVAATSAEAQITITEASGQARERSFVSSELSYDQGVICTTTQTDFGAETRFI